MCENAYMTRKGQRIGAFCIVLLALAVGGITLWYAVYAPDGSVSAPTAAALPAIGPAEIPLRLQIPKLSIDAKVQQVGKTASGAMGTPNNFTDVAWYKLGTPPGQVGSAVIDGHVDNGLSLAGVFKHLDQVSAGDSIYVVTQSGAKLHFIVEETDSYPIADVPLAKVFARNDAARLALITCSGAWVPGKKTYDQRLVVYAKLAP